MDKLLSLFKGYEAKEEYSFSKIIRELKMQTTSLEKYLIDLYILELYYSPEGDLNFSEDFIIEKFGKDNFFYHLKQQVKKIKNSYVLAKYYEILWKYESKLKKNTYREGMIRNIISAVKEKKLKENYFIEDYLGIALTACNKKDEFKDEIIDLILQRREEHKNTVAIYEILNENKLVSKDIKKMVLKMLKEELNGLFLELDNPIKYEKHLKIIFKVSKNNIEEIDELLKKIIKYLEKSQRLAIYNKSFTEELLRELKTNNLEKKIDKKNLEKLKCLSMSQGKKIKFPLLEVKTSISNKKLKEIKKECLDSTLEKSILRLKNYQFDLLEIMKENNQKKKLGLADLFFGDSVIIDSKGRTSGIAATKEQKKIHKVSESIQIYFSFFKLQIDEIFKEFNVVDSSSFNYLIEKSIYLDFSDKIIVKKGIDFYISEDYISFMHLIIPRIENILRNFLESLGGSVIGRIRNDGFNYKILSDILKEDLIEETFTKDLILYLKIVLSENLGLNLRNELSHGIIDVRKCNEENSSIAFHTLLFLLFL